VNIGDPNRVVEFIAPAIAEETARHIGRPTVKVLLVYLQGWSAIFRQATTVGEPEGPIYVPHTEQLAVAPQDLGSTQNRLENSGS
jgi:hypothetical protein